VGSVAEGESHSSERPGRGKEVAQRILWRRKATKRTATQIQSNNGYLVRASYEFYSVRSGNERGKE